MLLHFANTVGHFRTTLKSAVPKFILDIPNYITKLEYCAWELAKATSQAVDILLYRVLKQIEKLQYCMGLINRLNLTAATNCDEFINPPVWVSANIPFIYKKAIYIYFSIICLI